MIRSWRGQASTCIYPQPESVASAPPAGGIGGDDPLLTGYSVNGA
jgi:hypothetical protein